MDPLFSIFWGFPKLSFFLTFSDPKKCHFFWHFFDIFGGPKSIDFFIVFLGPKPPRFFHFFWVFGGSFSSHFFEFFQNPPPDVKNPLRTSKSRFFDPGPRKPRFGPQNPKKWSKTPPKRQKSHFFDKKSENLHSALGIPGIILASMYKYQGFEGVPEPKKVAFLQKTSRFSQGPVPKPPRKRVRKPTFFDFSGVSDGFFHFFSLFFTFFQFFGFWGFGPSGPPKPSKSWFFWVQNPLQKVTLFWHFSGSKNYRFFCHFLGSKTPPFFSIFLTFFGVQNLSIFLVVFGGGFGTTFFQFFGFLGFWPPDPKKVTRSGPPFRGVRTGSSRPCQLFEKKVKNCILP